TSRKILASARSSLTGGTCRLAVRLTPRRIGDRQRDRPRKDFLFTAIRSLGQHRLRETAHEQAGLSSRALLSITPETLPTVQAMASLRPSGFVPGPGPAA